MADEPITGIPTPTLEQYLEAIKSAAAQLDEAETAAETARAKRDLFMWQARQQRRATYAELGNAAGMTEQAARKAVLAVDANIDDTTAVE